MPKFAPAEQIESLTSSLEEVRNLMMPMGRLAISECLTANEIKHVDLASQGKTKIEASEICDISDHTVKNVRNSALSKVGARAMPQLVRMAIEDEVFPEKLDHDYDAKLSPLMLTELEFVSLGLTSGDVGRIRGVSERTSRHIRATIYARMGAVNASHAVRLGMEAGVIGVMKSK